MKRLVDIALNLVGITPDRPAVTQVTMEGENKAPSRAICFRCKYWSGRGGYKSSDLICAVNIPEPTEKELEGVSYRLAYAYHDCPYFEVNSQLESRTIQLH